MQSEIWNYYDVMDVPYKKTNDEPENTIIGFLTYLYKKIPIIKRHVKYSDELKRKVETGEISKNHVDILRKYEENFENGEDMNFHLSRKTDVPDKADYLLYTWHLFHLHMSEKSATGKSQMKNNRSDTQLLCIIEDGYVYFIDVILHPQKAESYFNIHHLEIIKKNSWMNKIGFYEIGGMIPGTLNPKVTSAKDIFSLYSQGGINCAFEFDGIGYCPCEAITGTRKPQVVTVEMMKINHRIRQLAGLKASYRSFRFESDSNGCLKGVVELENSDGKVFEYDIL